MQVCYKKASMVSIRRLEYLWFKVIGTVGTCYKEISYSEFLDIVKKLM